MVKSVKGFGACMMCGVAQGKADKTGDTLRYSVGAMRVFDQYEYVDSVRAEMMTYKFPCENWNRQFP